MKGATSLGYSIISCTSEDPSHPASAIQVASIRSTGWQSASQPHYPIDLVVDLGALVELNTIQFVSHPYKIASRIDLYVAGQEQHFQALGSFQFSDNSHTNYTQRELRSATLNGIKAQYIKISIPGCHMNTNNPSNQVGIVSLNVIGKGGLSKMQNVSPKQLAGQQGSDTTDMLESLERQKKDAVAREDFKAAEALKQQIDRLRRAYDQVMQLQTQKNEAIAKEDYVTAQRLKNEIDYLLSGERNQPPPHQQQVQFEQQYEQPKRQQRQPPPQMEEEEPQPPPRRVQRNAEQPPPQRDPPRKQRQPPPSDSLEDAIPPPSKRERPGEDRPIHPAPDAGNDGVSSSPKRAPKRAMNDDHELATEPEELSAENSQEAGILVDLFGTKPVACFYSKAWNLKVQGITELGKLIMGLKDSQSNAYYRYCYIMKHRVQETHKAVFTAALENIQLVGNKLKLSNSDMNRAINQMISQLVPKVGCAQASLSKLACDFLVWLADKEQWDIVIPIIIHPVKNQNQFKIALAQLQTLSQIIMKKGEISSIPGLTMPTIMNFLVPCLESPKNEVRTAAIELVVALECIAGSAIYQYFEKLHPRIKKAIEEAIQASKEGGD